VHTEIILFDIPSSGRSLIGYCLGMAVYAYALWCRADAVAPNPLHTDSAWLSEAGPWTTVRTRLNHSS
jgi:hypothetical protein